MADVAGAIYDRSTAWMRAWIKQDRTALQEALSPDFVEIVIAPPGRTMDRSIWLETCGRYKCTSFEYRDSKVRQIDPRLAVMSSAADQVATLDGENRSGSFFLCDVWRQESDGQWRVCARYSTYADPVRSGA